MSLVKGVENPPGENHCFLNVIIQSLYRLPSFRDPFLQITHSHFGNQNAAQTDESCVLCSLQTILNAYQIKETSITLDPSGFRESLAKVDASVGRHQKADTAETLVLILEALHSSLAPDDGSQAHLSTLKEGAKPKSPADDGNFCTRAETSEEQCLIHRTFDLSYLVINSCSACDYFKSETMHSWFHYVNTEKLRKEWSLFSSPLKFGQVLHQAASDKVKCPHERCKAEFEPTLTLTRPPLVFTLALVWPMSVQPDDIRRVLNTFDESFILEHVFKGAGNINYILQGLVAFWGEHYVTYQCIHLGSGNSSPKRKTWMRFDDKLLSDLGSWQNCKDTIVKDQMRPVIAWFVREN